MPPKKSQAQEAPAETQIVLILVPNVWAVDVKWRLHDVVELPSDQAELLILNKQAKATKDDVTHVKGEQGQRVAL